MPTQEDLIIAIQARDQASTAVRQAQNSLQGLSGATRRTGEALRGVKGQADRAAASLRGLKERAQSARTSLGGMAKGAKGLGAGIGLLGGAIGGAIVGFARMGDEIAKTSRRTGFTTEAISELRFAAEQSGTTLQGFALGVRRMAGFVLDAERGLSTSKYAMNDLGITMDEIRGRNPEDLFMVFAKAIGEVDDATRQAALAEDIFGRSGVQLLPLLQQGADGMANLRKQAQDLGISMGKDAALAAEDMTDAMNEAKQVLYGLSIDIGTTVAPSIRAVVDLFKIMPGPMQQATIAAGIFFVAVRTGILSVKAALISTGVGALLVGGGMILENVMRTRAERKGGNMATPEMVEVPGFGLVPVNPESGGLPTGSNLPRYQHGTPHARGGWSLVGEGGPEVVNLPGGSSVNPMRDIVGEAQRRVSVEQSLASPLRQARDNAIAQRDAADAAEAQAAALKQSADSYIVMINSAENYVNTLGSGLAFNQEAVLIGADNAEVVSRTVELLKEGLSVTTAENLARNEIGLARAEELNLVAQGIKGGQEQLDLLYASGASYREMRGYLTGLLADSSNWLESTQKVERVTVDIHGNIVEMNRGFSDTAKSLASAVTESRTLSDILSGIGKELVIIPRTIDDIWTPDDPNRPGGPMQTGETALHFAQGLTNNTDLLAQASRRANELRNQGLDISIAQNVAAMELNDNLQTSIALLLSETTGLENVYKAMVKANVPVGEMLDSLKEFAASTGAGSGPTTAQVAQRDKGSIPLPPGWDDWGAKSSDPPGGRYGWKQATSGRDINPEWWDDPTAPKFADEVESGSGKVQIGQDADGIIQVSVDMDKLSEQVTSKQGDDVLNERDYINSDERFQ